MRQELSEALANAVQSGDKRRANTLRLICTAIKDRDLAQRSAGRDPLDENEVAELLGRMIRQRIEAACAFENGGQAELADKEREEVCIIRDLLPAQLGQGELEQACREVVAEKDAKGLRDVGRCMNALKERYAGQMDMSQASTVVKDLLR